jgi:hypothetical protein
MSIDSRSGTVERTRLAIPLAMFVSLTAVRLRPTSVIQLDGMSERDSEELARILAFVTRPPL